MYKGILSGSCRGVFQGRIVVRPEAQNTDAWQSNKTLLLSEWARMHSRPQLEIRADDVKCNHGAAVGQLDREALFYLRSRGIGEAEARCLLVEAFANEIVERINLSTLRSAIKQILVRWLFELRNGGFQHERYSTRNGM